MKDWIVNIIDQLGYWGLALMMFLENVFPPIPSELIMPLAGFTTTEGKLSYWGVVLAGTLGSVVGQLPLYYLGKLLGKRRLMHLADRYGKWLTVGGAEIDRAAKWFGRRGPISVLLCRLVPGVRSLISIPAGICGMNLAQFLLYSAVGMGVWAAALAYVGRLLGKNYEKVEQYMGPVQYVVFGAIAVALIVWVVRRKRRPPEQAPEPSAGAADADDDDGCLAQS